MAFQSIREFVSLRGRRLKQAPDYLLSIAIAVNGKLIDGNTTFSVSIKIENALLDQMKWNNETRLDVLIDSDSQLCMLKKDTLGYQVTMQPRKDGSVDGVPGYIKFKVPKQFDYIPRGEGRIGLTIVDSSEDSLVFEMPKVSAETSESKQESKHEPPQTERQVRINSNRIDRPFQLQAI